MIIYSESCFQDHLGQILKFISIDENEIKRKSSSFYWQLFFIAKVMNIFSYTPSALVTYCN